jgi:hypothetical protein
MGPGRGGRVGGRIRRLARSMGGVMINIYLVTFIRAG